MVSQKFTISKILVIVIAFLAFVICSLPVRAQDDIIDGPYVTEYENCLLYFYKGNFQLPCDISVSDSYEFVNVTFSNPDDVVTFIYYDGRSLHLYMSSGNPSTSSYSCDLVYSDGHSLNTGYGAILDDYQDINTLTHLIDVTKYPSVADVSTYKETMHEFYYLNLADNFKPSSDVDWFNARSNDNFSLKNVKGFVEDDIFYATWDLPDLIPKNAKRFPLLVDFSITDLDSGESKVYYYPAYSGVYGATRKSPYSVEDCSLSVNLGQIKDLPENYKIGFVTLVPYYEIVGEYIDIPILYKGQKSSIYLNYEGHYEFSIQTPADIPVADVTNEANYEKNIFLNIQNFFSGFFSNFGNMLKDLFIPSKEQIQSLFSDMESFFSDKLGFLWFPFDLAITIVETFTYGEADSMITVPPITINILGGIDLYPGGQFDMDSTGIFPYVRIVTSILLACAVAGLAYNKWDEWIGGHDN